MTGQDKPKNPTQEPPKPRQPTPEQPRSPSPVAPTRAPSRDGQVKTHVEPDTPWPRRK
jgi:hypothetical protein